MTTITLDTKAFDTFEVVEDDQLSDTTGGYSKYDITISGITALGYGFAAFGALACPPAALAFVAAEGIQGAITAYMAYH